MSLKKKNEKFRKVSMQKKTVSSIKNKYQCEAIFRIEFFMKTVFFEFVLNMYEVIRIIPVYNNYNKYTIRTVDHNFFFLKFKIYI